MNQRDRAFLLDMRDFMCMNRLATSLALFQTASDPTYITSLTMKSLKMSTEESEINELTQANAGNMQSIMIARIYAELIAAYEDLGTFGAAIKHRANKNKGIFARYVASETREAVNFLQDIIDSNIPEHPEVTLDTLLKIPSVTQLKEHVSQEVFSQLETYYQKIPQFLHEVATHYRSRRQDVRLIKVGEIPSSIAQQEDLAIILGFVPPEDVSRQGRLYPDVLNRIKHQFLGYRCRVGTQRGALLPFSEYPPPNRAE